MKTSLVFIVFVLNCYWVFPQSSQLLVVEPQGHNAVIFDLVFTSDGRRLISASWDKTVRVWDVATGHLLKTLHFPMENQKFGNIDALAISPDDKYLAVAAEYPSEMNTISYIRIIDLETYSQIAILPGHKFAITDLKFFKNGKYLASGGYDNLIKIWDLSDMETVKRNNNASFFVLSGHASGIYNMFITENMKYLISGSDDKTAIIWKLPSDLSQNITITSNKAVVLQKHTDALRGVAITPDCKYVVTAGQDSKIYLWDIKGKFLKQLPSNGRIGTLAISSDGKKLFAHNAGSSPGDPDYVTPTGYLFSLPDGNLISMFNKQKDAVVASAFYKNSLIATAGWSKSEILIWNADNPSEVKVTLKGIGSCVYGVGFGQGLQVGFSNSEHEKFQPAGISRVFDFENLVLHTQNVKSNEFKQADFEFNGRRLHNNPHSNPYKEGKIVNDSVVSLAAYSFTSMGSVVVSNWYRLRLFKDNDKATTEYVGHTSDIWAVAVSNDNKYLVSGGADATIKLWNFNAEPNYPPLLKFLTHHTWKQFFEKENLLIAASTPGKENWEKIIKTLKDKKISSYENIEMFYKGYVPQSDPLVSVFVGTDNEWICWTPGGYFACSPNADKYIGWQINIRPDTLAQFFSASQIFEKFYRPDIVKKVIKTGLPDSIVVKSFGQNTEPISLGILKVPQAVITAPREQENFFINYKDGLKSSAQTLKLSVRLTNCQQISEIRVYQNQKLIHSSTNIGKNLNEKDTTFDINLLNGKNQISVTVFNLARTESVPVVKNLYYSGVESKSNLYVIAIGINNYKNSNYNLTYSRSDAEGFVNSVNYGAEKLYQSVTIYSFYDEKAVKDSVFKAIDKIKKVINAEDVFLLYYAGHGIVTADNLTQTDEFFLVLHDITAISENNEQLKTKGISASELFTHSKEIIAVKQVFIFDACQSGGAVDAFSKRGFTEEKAITQLARSAGIVLLSASETQQYATEFKELNHGVFTYSIIEALSKTDLPISSDGYVTVKELASYLESRVPELTVKYRGAAQYPTGFSKGQDFPLVILKK